MARYIDADKLITALCDCTEDTWGKNLGASWWAQSVKLKDNMVECINNQPTADVAEVNHGEWKVHQNGEYWHYDCPFCDDGYATKGKDLIPPNYCQNCGAKMDGGKTE